jgi:hypothetical protein
MRTIVLAALNVVLRPPHRADRYTDLWRAAASARAPVPLRGDTGGLIGSAHFKDAGTRHERVEGDLYKFVSIDLQGNWLDLRTGRAAERQAVDQQVRIPANLRPNLRALPYVFFPKLHRLVFVSHLDAKNALSPGMARSLVEKCLSRPELAEEFGKVEVTVEPDRETLTRIFALPRLKRLRIEVSPPNALADVERKLFRAMEQQNADRFVQELESHHPEGLKPSQEIQQVAEVAQSNGVVTAKGTNESNRVVELSTADHPHQEKVVYNPNIATASDTLIERAPDIATRLARQVQSDG